MKTFNANTTMDQAASLMSPFRPVKSRNGGIGGTGTKNTLKPMKRSKLRPVGRTKRGKEIRVLPMLKELMKQIYVEADGMDKAVVGKWELEHINGRNEGGFRFGATLDLLNLQLVPVKIHRLKTNATAETTAKTGITQRSDFRSTAVQALILQYQARIIKRLGEVSTLKEYKAAIEAEIYAE